MQRLTRRKRTTLAAAATVAVVVNGGAAWAYWRINGSGSAAAAAGSTITLEVTGQTYPLAPLYPGATTNIKVTVTNDNPFPVVITLALPAPGAPGVDMPHQTAGCHRSGVSATSSAFNVRWRIGKRSSSEFLLVKGVRMTNESDSACQGATFTIPLAVSGMSDSG
jgi:hypothetical protein